MSHSDLFRPEALKRIRKLELRARFLVEGMLSGRHKSPFFGQSLEFLQHRQYTRGDDLRRIDWKVWGKQDKYYVKQFEDETNLRAALLIDASESMRYGGHGEKMSKFEYASTLAVAIAYLLLKQQDSVGGLVFDDTVRGIVPQKTSRTHLNSLIQALSVAEPKEKTSISEVLARTAEAFPKRGMVILFSDVFVPRPDLWHGLKQLRSLGHDIILFHILDDDELDFTFEGPTQFLGLEQSGDLRCNPRMLRDGYLSIFQEFLDEVRRGCVASRIDYQLVRTSAPLDTTLAELLLKRG